MARRVYVFHSALTPDAVRDALLRTVDEERRALFSLSGFRGERPLLGKIAEKTFRLRKRLRYNNSYARLFYARFGAEPGGTRIEGYFDVPRWARYFILFWLAAVVLIGTPFFIESIVDLTTGSHPMNGRLWLGLTEPPLLIVFGALLPTIGRSLGKGDEGFILQYVQEKLAARLEESAAELGEGR